MSLHMLVYNLDAFFLKANTDKAFMVFVYYKMWIKCGLLLFF